jgi:hypothetical protein
VALDARPLLSALRTEVRHRVMSENLHKNKTHGPCLEVSTLPMEKRPGIALVS